MHFEKGGCTKPGYSGDQPPGCPGNGGGSALLKDFKLIGEIVKEVSRAVSIPVSCKIRCGIKDFTDAWQTMHNENIALCDIEQYDEELFKQLTCLSDSLRADGYMDFSFAIYLAVQELKKIRI